MTGYLFVAPALLGIALFSLYPLIDTLIASLKNTGTGAFIGFNNYARVFNDPTFWKALGNTFYMGILSLVFCISISFLLATLIHHLSFGRNFFKSVYFLPNVVSMVVVSILFKFLFYPTGEGVINYLISLFGAGPVGWFSNPAYSRLTIVIMSIWGSIGYDSIIFLAGLQSISPELYEAAEIDGAGGIKKWLFITIPLMRPIFTFMIIMFTIGSMKRFTDVFLIGGTAGNPSESLVTIVLYIYRNAFMSSQVGFASAVAYILFGIILILSILNLKLFSGDDTSS